MGKAENSRFAAFDDKPKLFESYKLFFRRISYDDQYIRQFEFETGIFREKGLAPEQWKTRKEVIYSGGHDRDVWHPCVRDFLTLVFK
ncbi:MAG: hypothetical protein LBB81_04425 [Treponema sp.]|nr:hypothetical protein [Treponema sp.]